MGEWVIIHIHHDASSSHIFTTISLFTTIQIYLYHLLSQPTSPFNPVLKREVMGIMLNYNEGEKGGWRNKWWRGKARRGSEDKMRIGGLDFKIQNNKE